LKQTAACLGLALAPSLGAAEAPGKPSPVVSRGFKIGAVDWELTKAADPAALAVAARLGFDGLQVDLGDVESMRSLDRQRLYQALAQEYHASTASMRTALARTFTRRSRCWETARNSQTAQTLSHSSAMIPACWRMRFVSDQSTSLPWGLGTRTFRAPLHMNECLPPE